MRFGNDFEKTTLRACGHSDVVRYVYSNQRQRSEQAVKALRTVCAACRAGLMKSYAEHCGSEPKRHQMWVARLPELHGTAGQVAYAASVRSKLGSHYFALLEATGASTEQPYAAIRTVLRLLFAIDSCSFWIGAREHLHTHAWLLGEVETLFRGGDLRLLVQPLSKAKAQFSPSVVEYWSCRRPELLESARRAVRRGEVQVA